MLSLLATARGHYGSLVFPSLPFHAIAVCAIFHLNPKLHPYRFRSLIGCIIKYISPPTVSHPSLPIFPLLLCPLPSSCLSGVLWCSLIRASGIGCHYLSAVSGTLGTVQHCISIGKPCPALHAAQLPACTLPSNGLGFFFAAVACMCA